MDRTPGDRTDRIWGSGRRRRLPPGHSKKHKKYPRPNTSPKRGYRLGSYSGVFTAQE